MVAWDEYRKLSLEKKINLLYEGGAFVMAIRYYRYKVNLYLFGNYFVEVFINHKHSRIERICKLDENHSRMKFYSDQIKLPNIS